ncbi:testis-expressed protein 13B isoform X1 [Zalophus californianus]|uniref:Testis-expressed protein 13B isoform X1 n=1 Tax=Zalophus californianus TaxID=9704 RepID=A0A6P9F2C6_ZALCA|nr:testis-expressed protein 13B isoform X1 [Zalophus californianus]
MSLKPDDPSAGFQHNSVVAFINEKMAGHTRGPEFYLENISLSWEEVENKLRDILEDSAVPSQAKDACAWSSLALGVRFARRQSQLQGHRVHWLHDFAKLHKSAAEALATDLKEFTEQQEMERKESAFRLRQTQANLAEIQKEQKLLRWKLLQLGCTREQGQASEEPGLATASGAGTEGACEEEEESQAAATSVTAAGATGRERRQKDALGAEAAKELGGGLMHLVGAMDQKNYTTDGQREGELRSVETAMFYFSRTRVTPPPLPVQLPTSFTYLLMPSSPFPPAPAPTPARTCTRTCTCTRTIPTSSNIHSRSSISDNSQEEAL